MHSRFKTPPTKLVKLFTRVSLGVLRSPLAQRLHDGAEAAPLLGKHVFQARRSIGVEPPAHQSVGLQRLQSRRENIGSDSRQRDLEVLESPRPLQQQVTQQQDGPALADQIQRAGDRAVGEFVGLGHTYYLSHLTS